MTGIWRQVARNVNRFCRACGSLMSGAVTTTTAERPTADRRARVEEPDPTSEPARDTSVTTQRDSGSTAEPVLPAQSMSTPPPAPARAHGSRRTALPSTLEPARKPWQVDTLLRASEVGASFERDLIKPPMSRAR